MAHLNEHFKIQDNALNKEFFVASFEKDELENAYYVLEQNGQKLLFMALEFLPRDEVVRWANEIIKRHPDHRVFLTVHEYISEKSRLLRDDGLAIPEEAEYLRRLGEAGHINCGVDIKRKLIDPNPNVEFLVCGHYGCQVANAVGQVVFDKQEIATAHRSDPRDSDLGYGDIQCLNPERGKIKTLNADRLAREGMVFTNAHSGSSVCTPTRYGLLTGRYAGPTRLQKGVVQGFGEPLIAADRLTVGKFLQQHGYHSSTRFSIK